MKFILIGFVALGALADIIGGTSVDPKMLPEATCIIRSQKFGEKKGSLCSATIVGKNFGLSAKHCFKGIKHHSHSSKIKCGKKIADIDLRSVKTTNTFYDLATFKTVQSLDVTPMRVADDSHHEMITGENTPYNCAAIGYGLNNLNQTGEKLGAFAPQIRLSEDNLRKIVELMFVHYELEKVVTTYLQETYKEDYLPEIVDGYVSSYFIHFFGGHDNLIEVDPPEKRAAVIRDLKKIDKKLNEYTEKNHTAMVENEDSLKEAYSINDLSPEGKTSSIIQNGDSGGTFACLDHLGVWSLHGVNSTHSMAIKDNSTVYGKSGVSYWDKGYIIPIKDSTLTWLKANAKAAGTEITISENRPAIVYLTPQDIKPIERDATRVDPSYRGF